MKMRSQYLFITTLFVLMIILSGNYGMADDSCMFSVTADEVPPNIVILLDNGAEMKQVITTTGGQKRSLVLRSWALRSNELQLAEYLHQNRLIPASEKSSVAFMA